MIFPLSVKNAAVGLDGRKILHFRAEYGIVSLEIIDHPNRKLHYG